MCITRNLPVNYMDTRQDTKTNLSSFLRIKENASGFLLLPLEHRKLWVSDNPPHDQLAPVSKLIWTSISLNFNQKKGHPYRWPFFRMGVCGAGLPAMCYSRSRIQQVSLAAQQRLAEQRAKEGEFGCISSRMCILLPNRPSEQLILVPGNPLCDGFLLCSNAHSRLSTKSPFPL